ncbi:hypothetical protein [Nonomuraea sp. JJY05]|uniref:hypothetical protein n=1 Tax=Nonomuraea sp. JJY05 TaxID=3350255 RepID=UPI00373F7110
MQLPGREGGLPNPLALVSGALQSATTQFEVWRGFGHGDLHVRNILVPEHGLIKKSIRDEFQLIDVGRFSHEAPVSRDATKLLLSIAQEWLPGLTPASALRSTLAELVVRPHSVAASPPVKGYLEVADLIHTAAQTWAQERKSTHRWAEQNLLVTVGCALRYVARDDLPVEDRWWFLEVAALATRLLVNPELAGQSRQTRPTRHRQDRLPATVPARNAASVTTLPVRRNKTTRETTPGPSAIAERQALDLIAMGDDLVLAMSEARIVTVADTMLSKAGELQMSLRRLTNVGGVRRELNALIKQLGALRYPPSQSSAITDAKASLTEFETYVNQRWPAQRGTGR